MSPWVPRVLLIAGGVALIGSIISIAVGNGGPQSQDVGGVNEVQQLLGGVHQSGAYLGPDDAEITVTVFNDLQCTSCVDFELETIDPLIEEYARTGRAQFEFRHFSLAPNDTTEAAIAAEAAGMQGRQWQYLDTFLRNQDLARTRGVDQEVLREIAEAVPELDVDQWESEVDDPASEQLVRDDAMLAASLKLPAEPAVVVQGPAGQRQLIETPSREAIESAIGDVSQ